jgi:hypothetical protein
VDHADKTARSVPLADSLAKAREGERVRQIRRHAPIVFAAIKENIPVGWLTARRTGGGPVISLRS